jgi:hypothetical protein
MESKKINQLATELTPSLSDLTIIGDPSTGISKKITLSQMASLFTGTVEEYANVAAFPLVGVADTIYIALDTNVLYRWNTGTNAYVELSPNIINSLVFNDANGFDGTIALIGSVATLTITTALTTGSVGFIGASGALLQDNANFFWDDTNNRLGLGTNAPTTALDVFGSGIIGRLNGTSTNNAFLGFASAGTNKWSIGNVQSDHRFRIYSETNTAELVSVLQTGEFGIGIANPTTKFHIDGGASALIANLDANVSVAKSISFRSDNSNRFNIEVSGTESGSNAGADFFIRRYSDAGSLIDTPLTIIRSTGNATFSGILTTPQVKAATSAGLSINANSGTQVADFGAGGSANITFFGGLNGTTAIFSSSTTATAFIPTGSTIPTNGMYLSAANTLNFATNTTNRFSIASTGAATFTNSITSGEAITVNMSAGNYPRFISTVGAKSWEIGYRSGTTNYEIREDGTTRLSIANGGNAIFANNVGIGVSPSTALDVNGTINVRTNGFQFGRITTNNVTGDTGGLTFQYITGGNFVNGIMLTGGGNVGIGASTNPQNLLEVSTAGGSPRIRVGTLQNNNNTARFEAITSSTINSANSAWLRVTPGGGFVLGTSSYTKSGGDSGNFANLSSEVENPLLYLVASGNFGINTSTPQQRLDVGGAIKCGLGVTNGTAIAKANGRTTYKVIVSMNYDAGNGVRSGEWNVLLNNEGTAVTNTTQIYNYNGQTATFSVSGGNLIIDNLSGGNNQAAVFTT